MVSAVSAAPHGRYNAQGIIATGASKTARTGRHVCLAHWRTSRPVRVVTYERPGKLDSERKNVRQGHHAPGVRAACGADAHGDERVLLQRRGQRRRGGRDGRAARLGHAGADRAHGVAGVHRPVSPTPHLAASLGGAVLRGRAGGGAPGVLRLRAGACGAARCGVVPHGTDPRMGESGLCRASGAPRAVADGGGACGGQRACGAARRAGQRGGLRPCAGVRRALHAGPRRPHSQPRRGRLRLDGPGRACRRRRTHKPARGALAAP